MEVAPQPAGEPFLTVRMSREAWEVFTSGAVAVGFFGGPDGRGGLTRSRIERLRGIRGTVRFTLAGLPEAGRWTFEVALGEAPRDQPDASVTLSVETAAKLRSGQLLPQTAFLQGLVQIAGDVALLTRLAGALFA